MDRTAVRWLLVSLLVVGLVGFAGPATSGATFTDAHDATGSIAAAGSFDGTPSQLAYDDANRNGQHDSGETTYTESELLSFDDQTVNLVIPSAMSPVDSSNSIQITAETIDSGADITSQNGNVSLSVAGGDVNLTGATVTGKGAVSIDASGNASFDGGRLEAEQNDVQVQAGGDASFVGSTVVASKGRVQTQVAGHLDLAGATVRAPDNGLQLTAQRISASQATFASKKGDMTLAATNDSGGPVDLTGAFFDGQKENVHVASEGNVDLTDATFQTKNGQATANLGTSSATLYVDGAALEDRDNTLVYDPDGITVQGTPASGTTSP